MRGKKKGAEEARNTSAISIVQPAILKMQMITTARSEIPLSESFGGLMKIYQESPLT